MHLQIVTLGLHMLYTDTHLQIVNFGLNLLYTDASADSELQVGFVIHRRMSADAILCIVCAR